MTSQEKPAALQLALCHEKAVFPTFGSDGAAGLDLQALEGGIISAGDAKVIRTGVVAKIPAGYVGLVCSRSGLAAKREVFVLNAPGIIDSDYRGELQVILKNSHRWSDFAYMAGDRIAQLVIVPCFGTGFERVMQIDADETSRGTGGLGSTGA